MKKFLALLFCGLLFAGPVFADWSATGVDETYTVAVNTTATEANFKALDGTSGTAATKLCVGTGVEFEGATANTYETTLTVTDPTADRTVTIPDGTGTLAFQFASRGDPTAVDFDQTTISTDETWRDLSLASIVPAGATCVLLQVYMTDDLTGTTLKFRKNGNSNAIAAPGLATQTANIGVWATIPVACDTSRVVEYWGTNVAVATIQVVVLGWWF